MRDPLPPDALRDRAIRPLRWRLPLAIVLLLGVATLAYVDRLLVREYRREATTQAVQTQALLESFLGHRVALLNALRALIATAPTAREGDQRFSVLARELMAQAPDMASIYLLDSTGRTRRIYRRTPDAPGAAIGEQHGLLAAGALALQRARRTGAAVATGSVRLSDGEQGMLIYVPVFHADRLTGFIGGTLTYAALFNDALAGQLQGHFAYRITDDAGAAVAVSPAYPETIARHVRRGVGLPGGAAWTLDVAVPPFQPFTARAVLWTVGTVALLLLATIVLREEARARRLAGHSLELELLSRNLLDANLRLEERAQQIAQANRAKSRFLANVSHELRTPLNAIVGYNSLALDGLYGDLSESQRAAHDRIRSAAEHLLGLVNDVLDLAKIEVGRMAIDAQEVDVAALVDSVATVIEPIAEAKGLRLDVIVDRGLPRIRTDPRHVRQILLNLLSNAVKFTERGAVTLHAHIASGTGHAVAIGVEDTGIGIDETDLERVFEEFEQVRPSGRGDSMQRGTGLGLAIARKLARLLGGDVLASSRVGVGSRFTLVLPLGAPEGSGSSTPSGEGATAVSQEVERGVSSTAEASDGQANSDGAMVWHSGAALT